MMKIHYSNNILNEATAQQMPNITPQLPITTPNINDIFADISKQVYMAELLRQHLNVVIKMPQGVDYRIPPAPQDLKTLMQNLSVTENERFKNLNNMLLDPADTYDNAPDDAKLSFANLPGELSIMQNAKNVSESVIFEDISGAFQDFTSGLLGMTGAVAGGIGKAIAVPMVGAYGLGAAAGYFGSASPGGYNDELIDQLSDENKNLAHKTKDSKFNGTSAIEAIDKYVYAVINSVAGIGEVMQFPGEAYKTFKNNVLSMLTNTSKAKAFIDKNDTVLKTLANEELNKLQQKTNAQMNKLTLILNLNEIISSLYNINDPSIDKEKIKELVKIIANVKEGKNYKQFDAYITKFIKNLNAIIPEDKQTPDIKGLINQLDNTLLNLSSNTVSESYRAINEADITANVEKPVFDCVAYYNDIYKEITKYCDDLIPIGHGKQFSFVTLAKEEMDKLKNKANEEIITKIEQICRTSQNANSSGVLGNVTAFISKHPMDAAALKRLWESYMTDLNMRENRRLEQMANTGNKSYITGWTAAIVKEVLPHTLARMMTYKYLLEVLKNENMYTYTTQQQQADEDLWEEHKEDFMETQQPMLILYYILRFYNQNFNRENKPTIIWNNGSPVFTDNPFNYLSIIAAQLTNSNYIENKGSIILNTLYDIVTTKLANLSAKQFIQCLYSFLIDFGANISILNIDNLTNSVVIDSNVKNALDKYYDYLKNFTLTSDREEIIQKNFSLIKKLQLSPKNITDLANNIDKLEQLSNSNDYQTLAAELNKFNIDLNNLPKSGENVDLQLLFNCQATDDYYLKVLSIVHYVGINYAGTQVFQIYISLASAIIKIVTSTCFDWGYETDEKKYPNAIMIIKLLQTIGTAVNENNTENLCKLLNINEDQKKYIDDLVNTDVKQFEEILKKIAISLDKLFDIKKSPFNIKINNLWELFDKYNQSFIDDGDIKNAALQNDEYFDEILTALRQNLLDNTKIDDNLIAEFRTYFDDLQETCYIAVNLYDKLANWPDNKQAVVIQDNLNYLKDVMVKTNLQFIIQSHYQINSIVEELSKTSSYKDITSMYPKTVINVLIDMQQNKDDKTWADSYGKLSKLVIALKPLFGQSNP